MSIPSNDPAAPVFSPMFRMLFNSLTPSLINAGVELSVFDTLELGPADAAAVARKVGASERGLQLLLNALSSVALLELDGDVFGLTPLARRRLLPGHPAFAGALIRFYPNCSARQ